MTTTEIDRLLVRLMGDNSSLHAALAQAQKDIQQLADNSERHTKRTSHGMHGSLRAVHMLVHGFHSLLNVKGPEQVATSVGHMALGIGHHFGMVGTAIGAAVSIIGSLVAKGSKEFNLFGESAKKGASKAVTAFAGGASKEDAIAQSRSTVFKKRMEEAGEGAASGYTRFWASKVGTVMTSQEYFQKKVNQGLNEQIEAQRLLTDITDSATGKLANKYADVLEETTKVNKSLEEMKYKVETIGVPTSLRRGVEGVAKARDALKEISSSAPRMAGEGDVKTSKVVYFDKEEYKKAAEAYAEAKRQAEENLAKQKEEFVSSTILDLDEAISEMNRSVKDVGIDKSLSKAREELEFIIAHASEFGDRYAEAVDKARKKVELTPKVARANFYDKMSKEVEYGGLESHLKEAMEIIDKFPGMTDKEKEALKGVAKQTEEAGHALKEKNEEETAGMKGSEKEAYIRAKSLRKSEAETAEMVKQARLHDDLVEGKNKIRDLQEETAKYGKSDIGYLAGKLEATGRPGDAELAKNLRIQEQGKFTRDLTEATEEYNAAMNGATKADLAALKAKDPYAKALAYGKTLLDEGRRVTEENMNPAEKYNQTHRELDDLLKHNTISQETYNRAVGKAAQQFNGVREAIQGVAAGSADAFGKILAYQDSLQGLKPSPIGLGSAAGIGTPEAQSRVDMQGTLQLMLAELQKANKTTPVQVSPANLGGEGNRQ